MGIGDWEIGDWKIGGVLVMVFRIVRVRMIMLVVVVVMRVFVVVLMIVRMFMLVFVWMRMGKWRLGLGGGRGFADEQPDHVGDWQVARACAIADGLQRHRRIHAHPETTSATSPSA